MGMVRPGSMPRPRGAARSMCRRNRRERLSLPAQIKVLYYKGFRTGKAALFEVASHKDNDTFGVRRQAPKGRPRRFRQRLYAASRDRWSAIESGVFALLRQGFAGLDAALQGLRVFRVFATNRPQRPAEAPGPAGPFRKRLALRVLLPVPGNLPTGRQVKSHTNRRLFARVVVLSDRLVMSASSSTRLFYER